MSTAKIDLMAATHKMVTPIITKTEEDEEALREIFGLENEEEGQCWLILFQK